MSNTRGFVTTLSGATRRAERTDEGLVRMKPRYAPKHGESSWIRVTSPQVRDSFRPLCPRCGADRMSPVDARNALSRKDNATYVCDSCGTDEAMVNMAGGRDADVWPGFPGIALHYRQQVST
jgi:predicted RNA-binding Zn-ribbon protein involved in translation (DUF1610 family)